MDLLDLHPQLFVSVISPFARGVWLKFGPSGSRTSSRNRFLDTTPIHLSLLNPNLTIASLSLPFSDTRADPCEAAQDLVPFATGRTETERRGSFSSGLVKEAPH